MDNQLIKRNSSVPLDEYVGAVEVSPKKKIKCSEDSSDYLTNGKKNIEEHKRILEEGELPDDLEKVKYFTSYKMCYPIQHCQVILTV